MYPTVTDQLRELCRVLNAVVMPELQSSYATDTLASALSTLKMIEGAWDRVVPFLLWDNEQLTGLLGDSVPVAPSPDPSDFAAVHQRNLELREHLASAVRSGAPPTAPLITYFRDRLARYPFASTVALPTRK